MENLSNSLFNRKKSSIFPSTTDGETSVEQLVTVVTKGPAVNA